MADYPALMLWTDAYLGDAYHLSTEEHGAYFLLLIAAWRTPECRLPDDDHFLARVTKATIKRWRERLRPAVAPFWDIANGYWTQKRLLREREKTKTICAKRSRAANEKWRRKRLMDNGTDDTHADAHGMQRARATPHPHPEDSYTPESYTNVVAYKSDSQPCTSIVASAKPKQPRRHSYPPDFDRFWSSYPTRPTDTKAGAFKAWDKTVTSGVDPPTLQAGADRYGDFCRRTGHESMLVQTWTNREGWTASYEGGNGNGKIGVVERVARRLREEAADYLGPDGPVVEGRSQEWRGH